MGKLIFRIKSVQNINKLKFIIPNDIFSAFVILWNYTINKHCIGDRGRFAGGSCGSDVLGVFLISLYTRVILISITRRANKTSLRRPRRNEILRLIGEGNRYCFLIKD